MFIFKGLSLAVLSLYNVRGCLLMISQMTSDSQVQPGSIFGRDRRRGSFAEGALVDSDETQPPSQPLDHPVISHDERLISHGSSDATGNPGASEVLSPEGLWCVSKPHVDRPFFICNFIRLYGFYVDCSILKIEFVFLLGLTTTK